MHDHEVPKPQPYSLSDLMVLTVQRLYDAFLTVVKDIPQDEFIEKVMMPLPRLDSRETDKPLEILLQYATDEDKAKGYDAIARSPISPILLSATYYFRAKYARDKSQSDAAWLYLAEAQYWCGLAMAGKALAPILQRTIGGLKRDMAAAGAKGRSAKYQPLRDLACNLARNSAPPNGWHSRNHAVQAVKPKVLELAEAKGITISPSQIDKTIHGWLATLPDAAQLFSSGK